MAAIRTVFFQSFLILALAVGAAAIRGRLPNSLSWAGAWPTTNTPAEAAYKMMARAQDPPFASLAEALQLYEDKSAVFLDARSSEEFRAGHVPGSRSLPFYDLDTAGALPLLGLAKNYPLVIYCEGVGCELSLFLGRELQKRGYTNLKIFYGGYPEWTAAGLPVEK